MTLHCRRGPFLLSLLLPPLAALALLAGGVPVRAQTSDAAPRLLVWTGTLAGKDSLALRWPVGVAAATSAEIAVCDAADPRVIVFRRAESGEWEARQAVPLEAPPRSIAHDGSRYVVSLRGGQGLVALEGETLRMRPVPLPREATAGTLAPVPGGGVLVHDVAGRQALRLGGNGAVEARIPLPGRPTALAAAPGGGVFVLDAPAAALIVVGPDGTERERFEVPGERPVPAWPVSAVVEPGGDLLLVDRHGGRIVVLDALGRTAGVGARRGWDPGLLLFPSAITRLPDGMLAVADLGNGRVQLFRRAASGGAP